MRTAHITSRDHQIGDKVLGLCGEEFKVKTLWANLADDEPVCRPCIDAAVIALTEADQIIEQTRDKSLILLLTQTRLDEIASADAAHQQAQEAKQQEKADRKRARETCTCRWSGEVMETDPACPVHNR